jgi:hypothetical protein
MDTHGRISFLKLTNRQKKFIVKNSKQKFFGHRAMMRKEAPGYVFIWVWLHSVLSL